MDKNDVTQGESDSIGMSAKKVNKTRCLTYLSINIGYNLTLIADIFSYFVPG